MHTDLPTFWSNYDKNYNLKPKQIGVWRGEGGRERERQRERGGEAEREREWWRIKFLNQMSKKA